MHDPLHFKEQKYICEKQKARSFDIARLELGFGEAKPEDAIPKDGCYWCNRNENLENYSS